MNRMKTDSVPAFIRHHFRHFNAAVVCDAGEGYRDLLNSGGKMFLTLAGAMSTAELGISLAEMIRQGKVHAISCTGANMEEDVFNLIAHDFYVRVPNYRDLSPSDEAELLERNLNRVTDTCIPEDEAFRRVESVILEAWRRSDSAGESRLPHEFIYDIIRSGGLEKHYQIDPADSWIVAACEKNLPLFVPGWEDSTLGQYVIVSPEQQLTIVRLGKTDDALRQPLVEKIAGIAALYPSR
jgi:deoxyhypusine synthase